MKTIASLSFVALLSAVAACTDSHDHEPTGRATCDEIVERCHPLDIGTGAIHECHAFAEASATTNAQCVARRAECFATCTATDAGADASSDAGSDAPTSQDR